MYKDILVHLEPAPATRSRLAAAAALAARFDARLTGLYVVAPNPTPVYAGDPMGGGAVVAAQLEAESETNPFVRHLEEAERELAEAAAARGVDARWRRADGPIAPLLGRHARTADLVVVGADSPQSSPPLVPGLAGETALNCGRPVLVVPSSGDWDAIATRALVAWNGSREATRALHDALPLLAAARQVTVVAVPEHAGEASAPAADVVEHLERHGVAAEAMEPATDLGVGDELLARAADRACDLLVTGAYGHSRLRELVFGGVTRHLLAHPALPLLMSH